MIFEAPKGNIVAKKLLGAWLVENGLISQERLDHCLDVQDHTQPRPLMGAVMRSLNFISEDQLTQALAVQADAPLWDLTEHPPDPTLKDLIPASLAQTSRVLPQASENGYLRCVATGPLAAEALAKLEFLAGRPVRLAVVRESDFAHHLQELYGVTVESMIEGLEKIEGEAGGDQEIYLHDLQEMAREPTLINLVNMIVSNAIEQRASDIHIEPFEAQLKIKYRIDGILHEMPPPPKHLQSAIISRVKIMAGMDIAERYVPQDGQFRVNLLGERVDVRVATVPTIHGESVVLRLLNKDESLLNLTHLGMEESIRERYSSLLRRSYGILLVCGPTGSGKTTTLYGSLIQIYTPEKKIITIEDPVEYQIAGITQIPVRPRRGLDFAHGLRAIVRQDPDIIMVGEVRDRETADIAIRAALTGHLVFSTLHTNDAPGAVTRLLDMGVEPFLIASSIQGVLAQRLVRRLCAPCRAPAAPDPILARQFDVTDLPERVFEPRGCEECLERGYKGRVGIFELLTMHEKLHDMILHAASSTEIKHAAREHLSTMRMEGWNKICAGVTSVTEVLQATQYERIEAV